MKKDRKQLIKAIEKINLINNIIDSYEKINELEKVSNMKPYYIVLDYIEEKEYTKFLVKFQKNKEKKIENIFEVNFSIKDKSKGLLLFQKLRESFIERDNVQYSGFVKEYERVEEHIIKKHNNIELKTIIHKNDDIESIKNCNKSNQEIDFLYNLIKNKPFDEKQLIKAHAKANIVCNFINTLCSLNNMEENYDNMKPYKLIIDYSIRTNYNDREYYKYNIIILKNGLIEDKKLLDISFSLKNKIDCLKIISKIITYFKENTQVFLSTIDNQNYLKLVNNSKFEVCTKINTPEEKKLLKDLSQKFSVDESTLNTVKCKKLEKI